MSDDEIYAQPLMKTHLELNLQDLAARACSMSLFVQLSRLLDIEQWPL